MRKITRYVSRTIFTAIALTLFVFLALDFIFGLINQLDSVTGNYTAFEAFKYMLLSMPRRIYDYVPYTCLIGCLAGLGMLASTSELTIIRAAGVSVSRIAWMTVRPALAFIFVAAMIGEFVAPYTEQMADNRRSYLRYNTVKQAPQNMWNREGNEFMYVNAVMPSGVIYGLTRYTFDDSNRLIEASFSKEAVYEDGAWRESDVSITRVGYEEITNSVQASRVWTSNLTPNLLNILVLAPEDVSVRSLGYYINYLDQQSLNADAYRLAFWQKILQPIATISLVLVAISFIFGPLRSVSMGQRIFTGVVIGIVFVLLQKILGPSSMVFGFPPVIAVLIPIVLCFGLGGYLLRRAK
jgi:lipopolysaccharide export system permease protein